MSVSKVILILNIYFLINLCYLSRFLLIMVYSILLTTKKKNKKKIDIKENYFFSNILKFHTK